MSTTAKKTRPKQPTKAAETKQDENIVDLEDGTGLGDKIEAAIPETLKKAVKAIAGEDCGCQKRKEWLNNLHFDYFNTKKSCMTEEQFKAWEEFKKAKHKKLDQDLQTFVLEMYNSVLSVNVKGCRSCSGAVWKGYIQRIDLVYESMKEKLSKSKNHK
ncbi:MAG: hypothetical protein AAGF96_05975 [Bacteroidota bacterium]